MTRLGHARLTPAPARLVRFAALGALLLTGCAGLPSLSLTPAEQPLEPSEIDWTQAIQPVVDASPGVDASGFATRTPPAPTRPSAADAARAWSGFSRAGREAMRLEKWGLAERSWVSAIDATSGLRPRDARIHATLGNLVRLAALHERKGRASDATRIMSIVSRTVSTRGLPETRERAYQTLYVDLTQSAYARAATQTPRSRESAEDRYDGLIRKNARRYRVDPALVKAVVAAESNFKSRAVSRVGAQGLMQLMPATAKKMGVRAPFRPSENIRGGVRYLRKMMDRYNDLSYALAAYNAGPAAVDRYDGIPPYRETTEYVERVLNYYREYQRSFSN